MNWKHQIVVPSGYMGSGSSAISDLLSEIDGYNNDNGSFEFVFMHCPDGLFDLEDKLLHGNNAIRSDEAIHRFRECMKTLYATKNYWVSGYATIVSPRFLDFCEEFLGDITDETYENTYWYYQEKPETFLLKYQHTLPLRIINKLRKNAKTAPFKLLYNGMSLAYPTEESFYSAARSWLNKIFDALGARESHLVLDQLLLPHSLHRISNYFDDNLRAIVVDRDPRDIFILNKYVWTEMKCPVPYPTDVQAFCKVFKRIREMEKITTDSRVQRVHFEDLVYAYDATVEQLYAHLGVDPQSHSRKQQKFNPSRSIKNTQVFLMSQQYQEEADYIAKALPEYIYPFPYRLQRQDAEVF